MAPAASTACPVGEPQRVLGLVRSAAAPRRLASIGGIGTPLVRSNARYCPHCGSWLSAAARLDGPTFVRALLGDRSARAAADGDELRLEHLGEWVCGRALACLGEAPCLVLGQRSRRYHDMLCRRSSPETRRGLLAVSARASPLHQPPTPTGGRGTLPRSPSIPSPVAAARGTGRGDIRPVPCLT
jgi:hypothetical protein